MTYPAVHPDVCSTPSFVPTLARPRALDSGWSVTSAARAASNESTDLGRAAQLRSAHNSITTSSVRNTGVDVPAMAGRSAAAKQAAPPRGVPR